MATLQGDVRRITYRDDQSHYTVAKLGVDNPDAFDPDGPHGGDRSNGSDRPYGRDRLHRGDRGRSSSPQLFPVTDEVTVVGYFPTLAVGEWLEVDGEWVIHPEFGKQFKVSAHRKRIPRTARGIERYLGSGAIKGIGPRLAERLVAKFGVDTIDVIEKEPHRLLEVEGIGAKKQREILAAFGQEQETRDALIFLQGYGIATGTAMKILRQYGAETTQRVREDPYRLADEVFGIGFRTADRIAAEMGIEPDSLLRGRAALAYLLNRANGEGHVFLPFDVLAKRAEEMGLSYATCERALHDLVQSGEVVVERVDDRTVWEMAESVVSPDAQTLVYPSFLHFAEVEVARRIREMGAGQMSAGHGSEASPQIGDIDLGHGSDVAPRIRELAAAVGAAYGLSGEQRSAVVEAIRPGRGVMILTGGPGTGKTTTLKAIVDALDRMGRRYELAAPTGRAAKRVQEATGKEARTIHRLLEYSGGKGERPFFQRNERSPLKADVVIVDESSMIDLPLMFHLLRALKADGKLILVGDADQLPSVGPGNVLREVLTGPTVRTIRLTQVFRQAEQSRIVVNAHRIQRGERPLSGGEGSDFFFLSEEDPQRGAELVCDLIARRIPNYLGCDPMRDIQALSAVRRGPLGVENLNTLLQARLNPGKEGEPSVKVGHQVYRVGDRVMQVRNDYDKGVFNGDIGRVVAVDPDKKVVHVDYPDREEPGPVLYESGDLHQIVLAYCTSVHKSQGSEYPAVVMPIVWVMPALMNRNLLYTAITRARRFVVLVGREDALRAYVRNARADERYTMLAARLSRAMETRNVGFQRR